MTSPQKRMRLAVVGVAIVVLLAIAVFTLGGRSDSDDIACKDFQIDSAAWKDKSRAYREQDGESLRQQMATGIQKCGSLQGKSIKEVTELLGPPEDRAKYLGSWQYSYIVGTVDHVVTISEDDVLHVNFDKHGRVNEIIRRN